MHLEGPPVTGPCQRQCPCAVLHRECIDIIARRSRCLVWVSRMCACAGPYLHKAFAFAPSSIGDAAEITAPVPSAYAARLDRAALGSLRGQLAQFSYALQVANPPASEKYEEAVAALPAPAKLG